MTDQTMHLKLCEEEMERLWNRLDEDLSTSEQDHQQRLNRWTQYLKSWRRKQPETDIDITKSMVERPRQRVPLIKWSTQTKLAHDLNGMFGEDAHIVAAPEGDSDVKTAQRVGKYMEHLVLRKMKIVNPFTVFSFRKTLLGKAFAYVPWETQRATIRGADTLIYEGPRIVPCRPEDVLTPAGEDVDSLHDLSWFATRTTTTPQKLLEGERAGRYFGITDNWEDILRAAQDQRTRNRDDEANDFKELLDQQEGVNPLNMGSGGELIRIVEWYGHWRLPKSLATSPELSSIVEREMDQTELVVRAIPALQLIIGVIRLSDLYPGMVRRRPFVEASLVKDGSYWSEGVGEMLYDLEIALSRNQNIFTRAMQFSIGPVLFADPASGFGGKGFEYEPFMVYPTTQPDKVNQMRLQTDLNGPVMQQQSFIGYAERISGQTDQTMGRSMNQPNAPRTASGQIALIEQGNIRLSLDIRAMKEDTNAFLNHVWDLDSSMSDGDTFFRVTEQDAEQLFGGGKGKITMREREERYDFDIKFATSIWQKEAKKQEAIALYQLDLQNPLIASNPRALWASTEKVHRLMGDEGFSSVVPEPPASDVPKNPREEWTLCLQGEEVHVNPNDNDDLHLIDHYSRLRKEQAKQDRDEDAIQRMVEHVTEQQTQRQQKMMAQALAQKLAGDLAASSANPEMGGLNVNGPVPVGMQQLQQQIGTMFAPQDESQQAQQVGQGGPGGMA